MGAEVPARGSAGTALRAQAPLVHFSRVIGPQPSWAGGKAWGASPPFHKEGAGAREVESDSFSGELLLHASFFIPNSFTSRHLFL